LTPGITGGGVSLLRPYFCKDSDADDLDPKKTFIFSIFFKSGKRRRPNDLRARDTVMKLFLSVIYRF
jgi:hypothetical protein